MGDPSYFRLVPESCLNDWSKIPEASKKFFKDGWRHSWLTGTEHPLSETFSEFVKLLNETKFFGYLEPKLCELLLDISEFGLASTSESQRVDNSATEVGLRFYMKYLEELWFVLLVPGKREGFVGNNPKLPDPDILDDDEKDSALSVDEPPLKTLKKTK
ncbi:hypothetical protein CPB84DRAFT_1773637 [Gymnopilus junonius]|uniref:Uncharacterized protein n=1 Tax=Gymnopilus junonius TaxID=109634 RepID=A0A9P5NSK7_GYMJU|nr:hypothetical protein CPB84DRAFT_1773637 [Gymnopilus junonius]